MRMQLQWWAVEKYTGNERNEDGRRLTEREEVVGWMDGGPRESSE